MSQPQQFGPNESDPLKYRLTSVDELVAIFRATEKPRGSQKIGIEYEIFGYHANDMSPLAYEGDKSITRLYTEIASASARSPHPFTPVIEDGHLVALISEVATLALEPGGQIEIAARPHTHVHELREELSTIVHNIEKAATPLGIKLFAAGLQPMATIAQMAQVKKSRYDIMRAYMPKVGTRGLDMMTRTCAIQLNLDFSSEADMAQKMKLGAVLAPFYALLMSSSPFLEGKVVPRAVERGDIWLHTDKNRTGIPAIIFDHHFGYHSWIDFVLDVPMYFIRRDSRYINVAGMSFRHFMKHGLETHEATIRDFVDHLSTVFTDVRLKPFIELRSTDSLPLNYAAAFSSLVFAHFYLDECRNKVLQLLDCSHQEIITVREHIITHGAGATFQGRPVFEVISSLLDLARSAYLAHLEPDEAQVLAPLANLAQKSLTVAQALVSRFAPLTNDRLPSMLSLLDPLAEPVL